eukprot:3716178-Prymnesium_polylepis.1
MSSFVCATKTKLEGTVRIGRNWDLFFLPNWRPRHPPYHVDTQREVHHLKLRKHSFHMHAVRAWPRGNPHPHNQLGHMARA